MLDQNIMGNIVQYSGDRVVLWTLRKYVDPFLYRYIMLHKRRMLIYGQVQSGKTEEIINTLKNPLYDRIPKIIVIQNSLLVLSQYQQRLRDSDVSYQVIDKNTSDIHADVILLINNVLRYRMFMKIRDSITKYVLFMDESDSYDKGRHLLADGAIHEYYITATPIHRVYRPPGFFHNIQKVSAASHYKGLNHITIEYKDASVTNIVRGFVNEVDTGMMLINAYKRVDEMLAVGILLSSEFPNIAFVTLNSKRRIIFRGKPQKIKNDPISKVIDRLSPFKHIVFIANRMSLRGLSYCSSDYSRHLTHQYSNLIQGNITNSLQRMRLFGKYMDDQPLKLILPSNNQRRIEDMFQSLDMKFDLCREFTL